MSAFSAPFFWGTKSEGFCFQSDRLLYGREPNGVRAEPEKAEAAKLPDAGISLKQCPEKLAAEKGWPTELGRSVRYRPSYVSSLIGTEKISRVTIATGSTMVLDSSGTCDGERRMAVGKALGDCG